jgi:putative FmdB family regulatory protein
MLYQYRCPEGHITELSRKISERNDTVICECGKEAKRIFSPLNFTFGFRLSDSSHERGNPDEFVRDI